MATKKAKYNTIEKSFETVKQTAANLNQGAIETADSFVEETLATGAQWQKIFAKVLKKGTQMFGTQQEFTLDTLESLKGQYNVGTVRFKQLLDLDKPGRRVSKKNAKAKAKTTATTVDSIMEAASKRATATKRKVTKTANDVAKKVRASVKKNTAKATKPVVKKAKATAKKRTVKAVKPAVKKVTKTVAKKAVKASKPVAKKATKTVARKVMSKAKTTVKNHDLKMIEGVGPKIAQILNTAGIKTFDQLAKTNVKALREILAAAGPRYKMHNPTTWKKQAALAAKGKWEDLTKLQGELMGGKVKK